MKDILHIYTRVSSAAQESEGTSLENQKQLGIKKAEKLGFDYKVWNEGGQSSSYETLDNRPVLKNLLYLIEQGDVEHLFVYNPDRLSRNQMTWGLIRSRVIKHGVTLYTVSGLMNLANPMDDLLFGLLSEISQYENKIRSERARQGRFQKIQQGNWRGGPPPFGYSIESKKLIVDTFESKWVKKIYDSYVAGRSTQDIRTLLDSNGVMTRRGRASWSIGSISKILQNQIYTGHYDYTDKSIGETVRIPAPVIITPLLFEAAQKKRIRILKTKNQTNRTKHFYLLTGLMVCGHCGSLIGGRTNRANSSNFYYCTMSSRRWKGRTGSENKWKRGDACSMTKSVNIGKTDEIIWNYILLVLGDSKLLREDYRSQFQTSMKKIRDDNEATIRRLKSKVKRLQKDLFRIEEAEALFEVNLLLKKFTGNAKLVKQNIEEQKQQTHALLAETEKQINGIVEKKLWFGWLGKYHLEIDNKGTLKPEDRKEYLQQIVKQIRLYYDVDKAQHRFEIDFTLPIVGDSLLYKNPKCKTDGWNVVEGEKTLKINDVDVVVKGRPSTKKNKGISKVKTTVQDSSVTVE